MSGSDLTAINKSMRQIAEELGHSRDTVKKAIESAKPATYTLRKPRPAPVLGPYKARIDELLVQNERLPLVYDPLSAIRFVGECFHPRPQRF